MIWLRTGSSATRNEKVDNTGVRPGNSANADNSSNAMNVNGDNGNVNNNNATNSNAARPDLVYFEAAYAGA